MILNQIADRSRLLVIRAPTLQSQVLGHGDLQMIDVTPIPDRFKDAIRQAEDQDILHRFFTKVVIDTVNLFFSKDSSHLTVELARRCEVVSKGFFNDDARPTFAVFVETGSTKTLDNLWILTGWCRKVEDAIATCPPLLVQRIEQIVQTLIASGIMKI